MNDREMSQRTATTTLGRYKILQRIGRGGMGDVWLCEDPRLGRQVAVKTLPVSSRQDREFALRFEQEAQAAAALHHPHILPVHDYGRQPLPDGNVITYIVMPYISGGSLAQRIEVYGYGLMPAPEALNYLEQAADAIDYAHSQQVIHRDIKPGNMLLRDENWLLLADFGIARIMTNEDRLTATGPGFGTPSYMAPEQAQGQAEPSSDNYSLAVIAYQLFTGRLPFQADTSYAITIQHLTMPPPSPRLFNPSLPPACEQALLQGLAKHPRERPPSARAFVEQLRSTLAGGPFVAITSRAELAPTEGRAIRPEQHVSEQETRLHGSDEQHTTSIPAPSLVTRRRLLIGGGVAALAAGGLGTWAFASSHNAVKTGPITSTTPAAARAGAPMVLLGHDKPVSSLSWVPQRNVLASASGDDGKAMLWDIDQLVKQPNTSQQYAHYEYISYSGNTLVAWSPDGKSLAISEGKGLVDYSVVEINTPSSTLNFAKNAPQITVPDGDTVYSLAWLNNRQLITLAQHLDLKLDDLNNNKFMLRLWDATQPKAQPQPVVFQGYFSQPTASTSIATNAAAFSPDGSQLAILPYGKTVLIGRVSAVGNATQWQLTHSLQIQTDEILNDNIGVGWSSDGNSVVALANMPYREGLVYWSMRESKPQSHALSIPGNDSSAQFTALACNPASTNPGFATGNQNGEVYLWQFAENSSPLKTLNTNGLTGIVTALAWSHDGHWLAASFSDANASILIWKI
ncbi:MAG: serine/threonine-protein kinase [Chloroflexota bacterium]|nr:serine/threonine-protein kinase [Chloroflexota bacterium]